MSTRDEQTLRALIAQGEGYNLEFKGSVPSKVRALTEEICAFANAAGGSIIIGVDDANRIVGTSFDNAQRSAVTQSIGEISPPLDCDVSVCTLDGKQIVVINVPTGPEKPYVFAGAIYVRVGANSQKVTTAEQMRDFFQKADKLYYEETVCKRFRPSDLDTAMLTEFKALSGIGTSIDDEQLWDNLKLLTVDGLFKAGAVLFFGRRPQDWYDHAVIRCVSFDGIDKRYIRDDKTYDGPLFEQYRQAMQWLKQRLDVRYDIESQGSGPRRELWEIPETALKEALINCLAHRDYYEKGAVIMIELYNDRLELSNPGGLISAIRPEEFGRRSVSRNPLIFGLFARMHMVEQVGSGIGRMQTLMRDAGLSEPVFSYEGMFIVTLPRPKKVSEKTSEKVSEKTSEKALQHIASNPYATIRELAERIGKEPRTIERALKKLKDTGRIKRIGSDKEGYWEIL